MKRLTIFSKDDNFSQEDSQLPLPTKKLCTSNSSQPAFTTNLPMFSTVSAPSQLQQNTSKSYQASGEFFKFPSSQSPETAVAGDLPINRDFSSVEKSEAKLGLQNDMFSNYEGLLQSTYQDLLYSKSRIDQIALNKNAPSLFPTSLLGVSHPHMGMDYNMNSMLPLANPNSAPFLLKMLQTQSNLQSHNLSLQLNQQHNLLFQKARHMMETANTRKRDGFEAFEEDFEKSHGPIKKEEDGYSDYAAYADEMDQRISELLSNQNKMLTDFKEKNLVIHNSLATALDEIKGLNKTIKERNQSSPVEDSHNPLRMHQVIGNSTDTASCDLLITYLCGYSTDFDYQLILKSELQLPLYRERNFKFTVLLTDKQGNLIQNMEEFPLTLTIYSSENPPKCIETNHSGNKVLKGVTVKSLTHGAANFEKIQIKEVTSHLRNGWLFIVVQPMDIPNEKINSKSIRGQLAVDIKKIKPLVIDKIVVKAKKLKEKEGTQENDGSYENF